MKLAKLLFTVSMITFLVVGFTSAKSSPQEKVTTKSKNSSPVAALLGEALVAIQNSLELSKSGDLLAKKEAWKAAASDYQDALTAWKDNVAALYGLANCCHAVGDTAGEIKYYRLAVYSTNPADKGFREGKTEKLMSFALVLSQAGQTSEAFAVYNHAASALDYQDSDTNNGKPYLKVLLPELVAERTLPSQVRYTPERLQALADAAIAYQEMSFGSDKEAVAHMQEAVKLYPDSPVTNYYLGEALLGTDNAGAKAAYQKAVQLGDDATIATAKERLEICR